jgi:YVTN family beta-propeller protein
LYVANYFDNTVSVIDGQTNTVIATIDVGGAPQGLVFIAFAPAHMQEVIEVNILIFSTAISNNMSN